MFDLEIRREQGICDWCNSKHFSQKTQAKAIAQGLLDGKNWNQKFIHNGRMTEQWQELYGLILKEVTDEMITDVIVFSNTDVGDGRLCKNCIQLAMNEFNKE